MSISDDDILEAISYQAAVNPRFRQDLITAVHNKNHHWISRLVRRALGLAYEVGKAVLGAIIGWFLPRPW
jgi:hypothetical protein